MRYPTRTEGNKTEQEGEIERGIFPSMEKLRLKIIGPSASSSDFIAEYLEKK